MKRFSLVFLTASMLASPAFCQTTIVDDDFEGYADQTAFKATWVPTVGNGSALANAADEESGALIGCASCATTDPADYPGIQGQAVDHIGATASVPGMVNQYGGVTPAFTINPSATESVFLSSDIFVGTSGNERMTVGLRSRNPSNLLEMGVYNTNTCDPTVAGCNPSGAIDPATTPGFIPSKGYAYRLTLFESFGGDLQAMPNWQYFELPQELDRTTDTDDFVSIADIGAGWHTYTATISETEITLTMDLFQDGVRNDTRDENGVVVGVGTPGVPDAEQTWQITTSAAGFNSLRIGGPSGVSSAGTGFMAFDNILLQLVEPSAGLPGDHNGDGKVDAADYVLWRSDPPSYGGAQGYTDWVNNFGDMAGSGSGLSAVPEPATIGLLMLGLVAVGFGRRSRR